MPSIIVNANGTVSESFSIGKSGKGIVIYQGDDNPSNLLGNTGDIFIKRSAEPYLLKKKSDGWVNVNNKEIVIVATSSTITATQSETVYLVDSSSSIINLSISSSSNEKGKTIIIKDSSGSTSSNAINISCENSETIDGQTSVSIQNNYTSLTLISDGTNWYII